MSDRLGELADHLIGHFVDQARKTGATWTDIGMSMGVTKQAAQKRFVPKFADIEGPLGAAPFSRFTDRARNVITAAQQEARSAGHDYLGTEHLVLGLLAEPEGLAARALAAQGITAEQVRAAVKVVVRPRHGSRRLPFPSPVLEHTASPRAGEHVTALAQRTTITGIDHSSPHTAG